MAFGKKFEAAILSLSAEFLKTTGFKHALTKGDEREKPFQGFLSQNLPKQFGIEPRGGTRCVWQA